jgi:hypothetical protein
MVRDRGFDRRRYHGGLRKQCVVWALAATALVALWQWATVRANYGGNWTALFCTGALQRLPPLVAAEHVFVFPNTTGFDGQMYHYVAHDPFLREDLKHYVDDARLRYRRILVPLLAWTLALGQASWVDRAYELVCLLAIGLGAWWSCRLAGAWGLLFLAMPAVLVTVDRFVVDGMLAALTVGFIWYSRRPSWKLFVVLACAALTRETGFLLVLAWCVSRRAWAFLLSALPALGWYCYVQSRTVGLPYEGSLVPLSAILRALANPVRYPPGTPLASAVVAADYLALLGVLVAFGMAFAWFARDPRDPVRVAAALFATMGVVFQRTDHWQNVFDFGRVYTPVLLCLAASRQPWMLAPTAMMLPRIAMQFTPQVLGICRRLL